MAYNLTEEQKKQLYEELQLMARNTGLEAPGKEEFEAFLNEKPRENIAPADNFVENLTSETRDKIKELMKVDIAGQEKIKEMLPDIKAENDRHRQELSQKAAEKEKKLMSAQQKEAIRSAKAELKELNEKQQRANAKREGFNIRRPYPTAEDREMYKGRAYWNPLRFISNPINFGTHSDRHDGVQFSNNITWINPKNNEAIPVVNDGASVDIEHEYSEGVLRGHMYVPLNKSPQKEEKYVLCFGGTGESAAAESDRFVQPYLKEGLNVVQFNYRGWGNSESRKNGKTVGTKLGEQSLYKDGKAMYDYLVNVKKVKPCNIIFHGYSLGGAIASKIAADIAEKNQIKNTKLMAEGKILSESQRLGGLVMHSPMPSNYYAASHCVPFGLQTVLGLGIKAMNGSFDSISNMRRLAKFDPNIPVHFVGGDNHDWLGPVTTGIANDPKAGFVNKSVHVSELHDHFDPIDVSDESIAKMCRNGRNAVLSQPAAEKSGSSVSM